MRIRNRKKYLKMLGDISNDPLTPEQRHDLLYATHYPWMGWHFFGINIFFLIAVSIVTVIAVIMGMFH